MLPFAVLHQGEVVVHGDGSGMDAVGGDGAGDPEAAGSEIEGGRSAGSVVVDDAASNDCVTKLVLAGDDVGDLVGADLHAVELTGKLLILPDVLLHFAACQIHLVGSACDEVLLVVAVDFYIGPEAMVLPGKEKDGENEDDGERRFTEECFHDA